MKKGLVFTIGVDVGLIIGILATFFFIRYSIDQQQANEEVHIHANFALFLEGERFDFARPEFMSIEPCEISFVERFVALDQHLVQTVSAHGGGFDDLRDVIHLHDGNGNTIHVHAPDIRYHDFFASLRMEFRDDLFTDHEGNRYQNTDEMSFRFFINNEEVETLAESLIHDLDRVLITYGPRDRSFESIQSELVQVSHDACLYSETCPERGIAPYESCGEGNGSWILNMLGLPNE